ncbi:MAG: 4-Cys prefix domain-containing protein [Nostoc sp.]|uniref:4-Cys prefix domain-containing protein n=1 Tax=Nostoc sp. TaxID=1180 RepID=UPI002FFD37B4
MSYCTNIDCLRPQNSEISRFCNSCGQELLLKQRYRPLAVIGRGGFGRTFLAITFILEDAKKRTKLSKLILNNLLHSMNLLYLQ